MFLALRELRHAKLRYTLIAAIMILVAWLTFMVSGLANGLAADNASAVQTMEGRAFLLQQDAEGKIGRSVLSEDLLADVQQQVGREQATPFSYMMLSLEKGSAKMDVTLFGIDNTGFLAPNLVKGSRPAKENEVVVSQAFEEKGIRIGDVLESKDFKQTFVITGFTDKRMFSHTPVVYVSLEQLQKLLPNGTKSMQAIALTTDKLEKPAGTALFSKDELVRHIPGYKEEQGSLTMMTLFLVVIAAFVQAGFFYVLTLQKTGQFGVLKAIGATTSYLAKSVVGQALLLAIAALVIALLLTFGAQELLPAGMPFVLSSTAIGQYASLLLLVSGLGTSLSLLQIARIDAIEAIGRAA
ncbi:FtsX-like permease family protein [Ectobacillus ponti]|uniref:Putative hemin transport system permease protein HrtB n=1 Tax=Ectobacillus ponti TaxID=2961894 RepID=A0AA42BR01_9BACI|nr:ABC transporter permease [Ectobacillus ponti]MCP8970437.1 ABC transporter permease [Ectobacillus ponti]